MKINIENHSSLFTFNSKIKKVVNKSIEYILMMEKKSGPSGFKKFIKSNKIDDIQVNLQFIDDKDMIKYNKKYFNRKGTTDVLAFSMIEGEILENNSVLGDALISVQTAKRNAGEYGHSMTEELFLYITHVILHLMGYEHKGKNSVMRKKEKKYFEYIKSKLLK